MSARDNAKVAAAALAVAGGAVAVFLATGQIPDSPAPERRTCLIAWAMGSCAAAQALSAGDVDCAPGSTVTLPVEIVDDGSDADGGTSLPPGFDAVPDSAREVPCAGHGRAGKSLTVVPMSKHGEDRGSGKFCPPTVIAGHEPDGCR